MIAQTVTTSTLASLSRRKRSTAHERRFAPPDGSGSEDTTD